MWHNVADVLVSGQIIGWAEQIGSLFSNFIAQKRSIMHNAPFLRYKIVYKPFPDVAALAGEKRDIRRPRVRSKDGMDLSLPTLAAFQDEEPLNQAILPRLLAGVSTRQPASWKRKRASAALKEE